METTAYARWFRGSTPYISAHRNKTCVVLLGGDALEHLNFTNIVHDLALLHVLGFRLVVVHGARPQIELSLSESVYHHHRRITDEQTMALITGVVGQIKIQIEAMLSTGLPNSPMHNVNIPVVSGNFISAKPIGVVDGVDHLFTGAMRRADTHRIHEHLQNRDLVLISPVGFSPSGQVFNLSAEDLAAELAIALKADKLIVFDDLKHISDAHGQRVSTLTPGELQVYLNQLDPHTAHRLGHLQQAVRGGVAKAHLISFQQDGALLAELFTAEGVGTQIVEHTERGVRKARPTDVAGIVEVIRPLEESGALVRRERDRLEQEIDNFLVAELDGIVVGCCAVYPYTDKAELACVGVHENYQSGKGIGPSLLAAAEQRARDIGAQTLFALTTQTRDWFIENGFEDATLDVLPQEKQRLYNWQRNSAVMQKPL